MKQIVFAPAYDDITFLYPFAFTRRVQDFRVGALTIREKWERLLQMPSADLEDSRYSSFFSFTSLPEIGDGVTKYIITANLLPDKELVEKVKKLQPGEAISADNKILISCVTGAAIPAASVSVASLKTDQFNLLRFFTDINRLNKEALLYDYEILTENCIAGEIHPSNGLIAPGNIFIEAGAVVRHAILNAEEGPIFIAKDAQVMEGACLRGPVYIGEKAVVKMGATIYGATTIGPGCVIGGEVKNAVFFANSNKGHDGYIGDSVIGEWCNFGAGTSCSNMKNNIGDVDYHLGDSFLATGQKKGGVMMGDFSRTAINTAINTGTVVGVSAHVFGTGLTPKIIPNFSWGFTIEKVKLLQQEMREAQFAPYQLDKALRDANAWKQLKSASLSDTEKNILTELYNQR